CFSPVVSTTEFVALSLHDALPIFGIAAAFLIAVIVLGTRLLPWLLKRILAWGSRELFLVSVVATGVGVGYGTFSAGLSFALGALDRKSTRLNSSHGSISYAVFCLK